MLRTQQQYFFLSKWSRNVSLFWRFFVCYVSNRISIRSCLLYIWFAGERYTFHVLFSHFSEHSFFLFFSPLLLSLHFVNSIHSWFFYVHSISFRSFLEPRKNGIPQHFSWYSRIWNRDSFGALGGVLSLHLLWSQRCGGKTYFSCVGFF